MDSSPPLSVDALQALAVGALEDLKGVDINILDVRDLTSITDRMVIVSGTSSRHVKSLADSVALRAKQAGNPPLGVEGEQTGEWILIGTRGYIHWPGPGFAAITNEFVRQGVDGGLVTLALFVSMIVVGFIGVGKILRLDRRYI